MKCNRCGKEIDELEIFCNDCKKELKKNSSRSDVKELEELIENQKRLTDLENTKELVNLDKLVEEELEKQEIIEEKLEDETKIFEVNNEVKEVIEEQTKEELSKEFVEEEKQPKKKNKKKFIIIISIVLAVLIISSILLIIFLGKDKQEEEKKVVIDYEKVINTYGNYVVDIVKDYIATNEDIPTWQYVIEKLDYDRYKVECDNHVIYSDGSIYLSQCKVNNKKTKYTYGVEVEEEKVGKKISIYKEDYDGYSVYSNETHKNSVEVGTITCKTENCTYINAFDKYVLIKEENEYYLYDYTNDSINFGPFLLNYEYDVLVHNNELYGIFYKEENKNNIYNVKTSKILKDIKGSLLTGDMLLDPTIMYKYNYVVLNNNDKYEFVNLKTGNVSYTIKENISEFIETENKKLVYIIAYTSDYSKFKIYNSNGKQLFNGKEYTRFVVSSNNLLVATDTNFYVYDSNLNLKTTSKTYDEILGLYENFVVAVKDSDLIILSIEDETYTTFEDSWDKDNNIFYDNLSGWFTEKNKNGIYLTIENKKIPYGTQGNSIEYYYIPSTGTSGFTEKISVE